MATGDLFLDAREPDCPVAPGEYIELARLPGVLFLVVAIMRREDLQSGPRFLLELSNETSGTTYLWADDLDEVLHVLTPYEDS